MSQVTKVKVLRNMCHTDYVINGREISKFMQPRISQFMPQPFVIDTKLGKTELRLMESQVQIFKFLENHTHDSNMNHIQKISRDRVQSCDIFAKRFEAKRMGILIL